MRVTNLGGPLQDNSRVLKNLSQETVGTIDFCLMYNTVQEMNRRSKKEQREGK